MVREESPMAYVPDDDPGINEASTRARDAFRYFWREMAWEQRRIVSGLRYSAVKLAFYEPTGQPGQVISEHMWGSEVDFDGDFILARLDNRPRHLQSIREGDFMRVGLANLSDWIYLRSGDTEPCGGFTINHLRSQMSPRERRKHDKLWGMDFGDPAEVRVVGDVAKSYTADVDLPYATPMRPDAEHPMALNMTGKWQAQIADDPGTMHLRDERGWTQLHHMALAGSRFACEMMIDHGADPNAVTPTGRTPAQLAHALGWSEVVDLLHSRGGR